MNARILTYHAVNISGNEYSNNDHVAFAADLRAIHAAGLRIVPLTVVVDALLSESPADLSRCVALTCDDGADFDYFDLDHPTHGMQRSLFNCLRDFRDEFGVHAQRSLHLTSFVIASNEARKALDASCLVGRDWMRETWWREAQESGLMAIENHSWDHNHPGIPLPGVEGMQRGTFHEVDNYARADAQVRQAADYINARINPNLSTLFCYPYGHVSDYLRTEYFPQYQSEHGVRAAFGDGATLVTADADRWNLPRYICGYHWKSPAELRAILDI